MSRVTTSAGLEVNLVRIGPRGAAPVVLLHALGMDLTIWDHQVAEFGGEHDVVALDLPGHGLSSQPVGQPSFDEMADVVGAVLAQVGAGPVHLVGLSVGGMVAQTLAVARPDLVRSLVLVATSCTFADPVRQAIRARSRMAREQGMRAMAAAHIERWFTPAFRDRRPDVLDRATKLLLRHHSEQPNLMAEQLIRSPYGLADCVSALLNYNLG